MRTIFLISCLLFCLILCGCSNGQVKEYKIPIPTEPIYEKVEFKTTPDGLLLDLENYKSLEINIINMRGYIKTLRDLIDIANGDDK